MDFDIDALTDAEAKRLRSQLDHRFASERARRVVSTEGQDIWEALKRHGGPIRGYTLDKLIAEIKRKEYDSVVDFVNEYITQGVGRPLHRTEAYGLRMECIRCLAEYLRARDEPATPRRICECIDWLPHAVDRQYPGYADARLLHMVVGSTAA